MKSIILFTSLFLETLGQIVLLKDTIDVPIGREAYLNSSHFKFSQHSHDYLCKVEVVSNEPMTQRVGLLEPQVFDCDFKYGTVKYVHHGSPSLHNDTVKLTNYIFLKEETLSESFELIFVIKNISYDVIKPIRPLVVKEFFGLTDAIDESVLSFNFSRKEGAICKVRMSRQISNRPAHGQIVIGREKRSVDVMKRRCDDFLQLGLHYEHLKPPSPDIDFILIIVEVSDPYINDGNLVTEWYHIPVKIEPGFPNLPPKASFSGMYLMDVDQFIITAITPAILSATDSETPPEHLIFNISRPLFLYQGCIVHLSDHTRPILSFKQSDLNNFNIAYKPPARSFRERQMFEIGFTIFDPDFAHSEPFTMHIAIRPAITKAPRVSMNVGLVLLEGQSRPLKVNNLEIVDSDNMNDVQIFVAGGLQHGKLYIRGQPALSFTQKDIISGDVVYHHDDSDSVKDSIHLRIYDGHHSTHTKFPITIIPKDDNPPTLVVNIGIKVKEGETVQVTPSVLRAIDHDTTDEHVTFILIHQPSFGSIWKKFPWENDGTNTSSFTQRDLNKGLVYFHHYGEEVFTDFFEVVIQDSNSPPNLSPLYKVSVQVLPVGDDPPKRDPACSFHLEVRETDLGLLSARHLHYMDIDSLDKEIVYIIISQPRFIGSFAHADTGKIVSVADHVSLVKESLLLPIKTFTQEQVNHHKIAYVPPADEIGPNQLYLQFAFSVKDKDNNIVTGQIFNITILPVNNQIPQLHTGALLVEEGASTLLSTNELSVYDPDTLTSDMQMSLFTVPLHGTLRRSKQPLRVGDLLSLDDILTLRLEYVHDGSESFHDRFKVGVNDGLHFVSGEVLVDIEPVDDEKPTWLPNLSQRVSLNEGGSAKLISEVLAATDVDTEDSSLFFILTEAPQFGNIMVDKRKVNRFSQKDVANGEVFYVHSGQEIGPSPKEDALTLIVTDKAFPRLTPHNSHKILVTILPQNNRSPRLYFKRAILVEEGQRTVITEENLSATDEDTFPAELLIVISKQPQHGYIENLRPTPGYERSGRGKKISAFPLQDVKNGFITFVQFDHRNIEPESDGFEVFVSDGAHNSTSILIFVSIILLNDEIPSFSLKNITVEEGGSFTMDNNTISASDQDFPGDLLIISVKKAPQFGSLTHLVQAINNGPVLEIPFNQLAFENFEGFVYRHDGSENFADAFTLSLSDGLHNVMETCFIQVIPVNDEPPVIARNIVARNVEIGGLLTISNALLLTVDEDSPPETITYDIISSVKFGVLEIKNATNQNWMKLESMKFTQEDIDLNYLRYKNVDFTSTYEDGFSFSVSDGIHSLSSSIFVIKLVDYGKMDFNVYVRGAFVEEGGEIFLNSSMLHAEDNSSRLEDIYFQVMKPPSFGSLILNTNSSIPVKNFTLFNVINSQISYNHNASKEANSDSFDLKATNGVVSKNVTFVVAVLTVDSMKYNVPVLEAALPLVVDMIAPKTIITAQHLLSYQSMVPPSEIIYIIENPPKLGNLTHVKNSTIISNFSQEDVNNEMIAYQADNLNASFIDQFSFKVSNGKEDGYLFDGNFRLTPTLFSLTGKYKSPSRGLEIVINPPTELENVWSGHIGFAISTNNLGATFENQPPKDIKFYVVEYLQHGYIFHTQDEKVVRAFTQEDIDNHHLAVILKQGSDTHDYFTFHIAVGQVTYNRDYRMDFKWAVVYFPHPEYSVCEDTGSLSISIKRAGNLEVSSYITVNTIEQTAKEGLDYVSRRGMKIQFDPGVSENFWRVMIVQDELEEAPIEQVQIVLSEPENCLIMNHNRTIISIYDLNRGSCSQIPAANFPNNKDTVNNYGGLHRGNEEETEDDEDEDTNHIAFPMVCRADIYGLLHFNQITKSLYQCDGQMWKPWYRSTSNEATNIEVVETIPPYVTENKLFEEYPVSPSLETSSTLAPELRIDGCLKGWQEYKSQCNKWHRSQSTWSIAESICKSYPLGQLVMVESSDHNDWLIEMARSKPFWIGLHADQETNTWTYDTTRVVPFVKWKRGFPRLPSRGEVKHRCVLVRGSGHWINRNCELHEHSFICSMPVS